MSKGLSEKLPTTTAIQNLGRVQTAAIPRIATRATSSTLIGGSPLSFDQPTLLEQDHGREEQIVFLVNV